MKQTGLKKRKKEKSFSSTCLFLRYEGQTQKLRQEVLWQVVEEKVKAAERSEFLFWWITGMFKLKSFMFFYDFFLSIQKLWSGADLQGFLNTLKPLGRQMLVENRLSSFLLISGVSVWWVWTMSVSWLISHKYVSEGFQTVKRDWSCLNRRVLFRLLLSKHNTNFKPAEFKGGVVSLTMFQF